MKRRLFKVAVCLALGITGAILTPPTWQPMANAGAAWFVCAGLICLMLSGDM